MSTRRVDLGSLDDAIGALADQLPGATRLSHVLAAGAKHLVDQKRQSADVAGYARSQHSARFTPNNDPYNYNPGPFGIGMRHIPTLVVQYRQAYNQLLRAGRGAPGYAEAVIGALANIMNACRGAKDLDYLREKDAYVALAYIFKNASGDLRKNAKLLLREALYDDRDNPVLPDGTTENKEKDTVVALISQAKYYIGGPDVAAVNPKNAQWSRLDPTELVQLDKLIRGDPTPPTADEVEKMKRKADDDEREVMRARKQARDGAEAMLQRQREAADERGDLGTYSVRWNPDDEDPEAQKRWA